MAPAPSPEVQRIGALLRVAFSALDKEGRKIGGSKYGVYAFYDLEGEPVYVGQTVDGLSGRMRRHLTNRRTDAVAMFALDPWEIAYVEMWPFWEPPLGDEKRFVDGAERTLYEQLDSQARVGLLNEKGPPIGQRVRLGKGHRFQIMPDDILEQRSHLDVWMARQSLILEGITRIISERTVKANLRQSCDRRVKRIERLSALRLAECGIPGPAALDESDEL